MTTTTIVFDKDNINDVNLNGLNEYIDWSTNTKKYFNLKAGEEHYRLLAWLSTQVHSKTLVDIGTFNGFSALALSQDDRKKVVSYDIFDYIPDEIYTAKYKPNIELRLTDCTDELEVLLDTDLIFIDIDNQGGQESIILNLLEKYKYKGLVVLDDINLTKYMTDLWNGIKQEKYDLTQYGHWSGTGLVNFDPSRFKIVLE